MVPSSPTTPPIPNIASERWLYPFNLNEKRAGKTNVKSVPVKAPTRSSTSPNDGLMMAQMVTINQVLKVRAACHRSESCLPSPFGRIQLGVGTRIKEIVSSVVDSSPDLLERGDGFIGFPNCPPILMLSSTACSSSESKACVTAPASSFIASNHSSLVSLNPTFVVPNPFPLKLQRLKNEGRCSCTNSSCSSASLGSTPLSIICWFWFLLRRSAQTPAQYSRIGMKILNCSKPFLW
mmetsp:Transcript_13977/g.25278  ORF Transcript_13977/g.25278 Transcript_13977/m.25278 type:complete len:236 (-) Transcript_13977:1063-1770(-)